MTSLQEACDAILQYLESRPEEDKGPWDAEAGGPLPVVPMAEGEPLVLASIRCLGRYPDSPTGTGLLLSSKPECNETGGTLELEVYRFLRGWPSCTMHIPVSCSPLCLPVTNLVAYRDHHTTSKLPVSLALDGEIP